MNDFVELESELKKLRPVQPSSGLLTRVEKALLASEKESGDSNIIRSASSPQRIRPVADRMDSSRGEPEWFKISWPWWSAALAAATIFLLFARLDLKDSTKPHAPVASTSPAVAEPATSQRPPAVNTPATPHGFIPAGSTQVVYQTRDEGLRFPSGSDQPVRRLRSRTRETLRWNNPSTGASLLVSYPSDQVELIPVSGQ